MDDRRAPPEEGRSLQGQGVSDSARADVPTELAHLLDASEEDHSDRAWDEFLSAYGHLFLRTAKYTHRGADASMDAYAYVLERVRENGFRASAKFSGGDGAALSRWLVVVARRLCSDFRRERYGRVRPATPEVDREARRRLVDEIWDPRDSSELPAPSSSSPEWELRRKEHRRALEDVMNALEPRDQLLLALRFENGLSARRISEIMDWPTPFHAYRKLNKLLGALRTQLKERGVEDPNP